jgi:hypothetical protein
MQHHRQWRRREPSVSRHDFCSTCQLSYTESAKDEWKDAQKEQDDNEPLCRTFFCWCFNFLIFIFIVKFRSHISALFAFRPECIAQPGQSYPHRHSNFRFVLGRKQRSYGGQHGPECKKNCRPARQNSGTECREA